MKEENKNGFFDRVEEFGKGMHDLIEKDSEKRGLIIIASEYDKDKKGSRQTETVDGNEGELVMALAGFFNNPNIKPLILKALLVSRIAGTKSSEEEQK